MQSVFEVNANEQENSLKRKTPPDATIMQQPFCYAPSEDGTDENLLILLHGLGDSHMPFFKLGMSLRLPQTAVLAVRALDRIPYLYEEAFQWYTSFNQLGELLDHPNPTPAVRSLLSMLSHLRDCGWMADRMHIFGFGQGGTVAVETGLQFWRLMSQVETSDEFKINRLGSIVTIAGPLTSYPTPSSLCPTPVLIVSRKPPSEFHVSADDLTAFRKGYSTIQDITLDNNQGSGMPSSRTEWERIMKFWSEQLRRRQMDGVYELFSRGQKT